MSLLDILLVTELTDSVVAGAALAREVFIALRRDGEVGKGTEDNPYDGSTAAAFDAVMNSLSGLETVRLGPGVFPTARGFLWLPKSGQRIVGSGMFATIIRLVLASPQSGQSQYVFGLTRTALSGFELSDLTIDCNLAGQPNTGSDEYPRIAEGGINLHGSDILIRRVRVINFGTNTPIWEYGQSTPPASWECFPLSVAFARPLDNPAPKNCVVEDCIVEQPALNNARETTCINLSAQEDAAHRRANHRVEAVLNNWMELGASGQARGIHLEQSDGGGFASVVLRGNVVRYQSPPASPDPTDYGIRLKNCVNSILENNVIDVGPANNAVYHTNCGTVKPFNNQTSGGVFRPGFDGTLHDQELTTEVEDVLLGLLMR